MFNVADGSPVRGGDVVGIDIVEIARIAGAVERHGERFLRKVFTDVEITWAQGLRREYEFLAGRFAAKEAFMKAMGRRLPWQEIEIDRDQGRPLLRFRGETCGEVSISHERAYAVAVVVVAVNSEQ